MQPHLAPPPIQSSVRLPHDPSILLHVSLSCDQYVRPPTIPQSFYHPVSQLHCVSIDPIASPSVIPVLPSYEQSVHPPVTPSVTCQSATPPISPAKRLSDHPSLSDCLYTIFTCPSGCSSSSDHTSTIYTRPTAHPPPSYCLYNTPISPSVCLSTTDCLTTTTSCPPVRPSSHMIQSTQDSIHSLVVVNGEQSHTIHHTQDSSQSLAVMIVEQFRKANKFHRAFTNYDLLLRALDAYSIYLHDLRHVASPKSGEVSHVTCGKCDFGGATLNNPSLCLSYVLPRLSTLVELGHHLMSLKINLEQ